MKKRKVGRPRKAPKASAFNAAEMRALSQIGSRLERLSWPTKRFLVSIIVNELREHGEEEA